MRPLHILVGAVRLALICLFALLSRFAAAADVQPMRADAVDGRPLGHHSVVLREGTATLQLDDAVAAFARHLFEPSAEAVVSLSIFGRPVWVRFEVENPTSLPLQRTLALGQSWVDRIDVHHRQDTRALGDWVVGDESGHAARLDPALGYLLPVHVPPGRSAFYIRAESGDPLVLSLALHDAASLRRAGDLDRYSYGLLYGALCALALHNLLMYVVMRRPSLLHYAQYLATFVLMNLCYTGRGLAWWWPDEPLWQRAIIPLFMVLFPLAGWRFARSFLELDKHLPHLPLAVQRVFFGLLIALLILAVTPLHAPMGWIGFSALTLFIVMMVSVGVWGVHRRLVGARYFLAAALCAMAGSAITEFTIWGFLPFTPWTFHAMEVGMLADATLLALALSHQVRNQRLLRMQAEQQALTDPLTALLNRRGFVHQAELHVQTASRHHRPLSLLMMDIDHFKRLNDSYGHATGDQALREFGALIARTGRRGDLAARWGGEEFTLLLPETTAQEATQLAHRLREAITQLRLVTERHPPMLSASFGVAQLAAGEDLHALVARADQALYAAKAAGRNTVWCADAPGIEDAAATATP